MVKTRIIGKVVEENGKFYWWGEFHIENHTEYLHVDSREKWTPYETKDEAAEGLKQFGRTARQSLIDSVGIKKVSYWGNNGRIKI